MKSLFNHTMQQSIQTVNIDPYAPPPPLPGYLTMFHLFHMKGLPRGREFFPVKGAEF